MAPVWFLGHGSPMTALAEDEWTASLRSRFESIRRSFPGGAPTALVFLSAHWLTGEEVHVGASPAPRIQHDFHGFPAELYALDHRAPGAPEVAREAVRALAEAGFRARVDTERPLDHGAWIPARALDPEARIPLLQISLQHRLPAGALIAMGAALAGLAASGALLVASGNVTHNLRELDTRAAGGSVVPWALAFEEWTRAALALPPSARASRLARWEVEAPSARRAHPSTDHFLPLLVASGVAGTAAPIVFHEGFVLGSLSMTCLEWNIG